MKKLSRKKTIALVITGLVLAVIIYVVIIADINVKAMNRSIEKAIAAVEEYHTVTPVSAGDYQEITVYGIMKFHVSQYEIEELGNLSIMKTNMGFMQMATFVITPVDKNLPLVSADYMYILHNRKSYIEYYNLTSVYDENYMSVLEALNDSNTDFANLKDIEAEAAWYTDMLADATVHKSGTTADDSELEKMLEQSISAYSQSAENMPLLTGDEANEKIALTKEYSDGLVEKGGISTDVFKQALGEETTKDFFNKTFFGTDTYAHR